MEMKDVIRRRLNGARERFLRIVADRHGMAALEFALIAPLLLSMYFVTMEVAQGIEANKKVSRVGSMVADLVTQQQSISRSELEAIMQIGSAILLPYNRSMPDITVTAIKLTDKANPKAIVQWSRRLRNGAFMQGPVKDTETQVPTSLQIRDTFLIQVSAGLDYRPVLTWTAENKASLGLSAAFDRIDMQESFFLRPRMTAEIDCSDC
jgi:Flp pilus assembly protein TadG